MKLVSKLSKADTNFNPTLSMFGVTNSVRWLTDQFNQHDVVQKYFIVSLGKETAKNTNELVSYFLQKRSRNEIIEPIICSDVSDVSIYSRSD